MEEFVNSLFKDNYRRLDFGYNDYKMSFYAMDRQNYYMVFFLEQFDDLKKLGENCDEIYRCMKDFPGYQDEMDKNTTCVFCLKVSYEEYQKARDVVNVSDLSKEICKIEEDLDYFAKYVFLYTEDMERFVREKVSGFDDACEKYLTRERFDEYKKDMAWNYEYDLLTNLFIKFPMLKTERYFLPDNKKPEYHEVGSHVRSKMEKYGVAESEILALYEEVKSKLAEGLNDEELFYEWLDGQPE